MKVYGVGAGEYEQYTVFAIYTNRDHADAVARDCGGDVTNYELDEPLTDDQRTHLRPGERTYRVRLDDDGSQVWIEWTMPPCRQSCNARKNAFITTVWASSEKAAVEAAKLERQEWIAAGNPQGNPDDYGWCKIPERSHSPA